MCPSELTPTRKVSQIQFTSTCASWTPTGSCFTHLINWQNFTQDKFKILDYCFSRYNTETKTYCGQKGSTLVPILMTLRNLKEWSYRKEKNGKIILRNGERWVTETQWRSVLKNVFERFECRNLEEYNGLYLKTDTLILPCVLVRFKRLCYNTYGLDSTHYFTCWHCPVMPSVKCVWLRLSC